MTDSNLFLNLGGAPLGGGARLQHVLALYSESMVRPPQPVLAGSIAAPGWSVTDTNLSRWRAPVYVFTDGTSIVGMVEEYSRWRLTPVSEVWYGHHNAEDLEEEVLITTLYPTGFTTLRNGFFRLFDFGAQAQELQGVGSGQAAIPQFFSAAPDADTQPHEDLREAGNFYFSLDGRFKITSSIRVGSSSSTANGINQRLLKVQVGEDDRIVGESVGGYRSPEESTASSQPLTKATSVLETNVRNFENNDRYYIEFAPAASTASNVNSFNAIIHIQRF